MIVFHRLLPTWLSNQQTGNGDPSLFPPISGLCGLVSVDGEFEPPVGWQPTWSEANLQNVSGSATGSNFIGFDIDPDVLDAGAEVLGVAYWRKEDRRSLYQRFRTVNLWPNSGNSWERFPEFSACTPGYIDPVWFDGCVSKTLDLENLDGLEDVVGQYRPLTHIISCLQTFRIS